VQDYGDIALKKTAIYKWLARFSERSESVTDEEISRLTATGRTEEICQIVRENRRLSGSQQSKRTSTKKQLVKSSPKIMT
jgi:hypothetical protein